MLRGQYAHNHGIWGNLYPEGGAKLFARKGLDSSTVATWLDGSGYRTTLVGKYLNEYETLDVPPGWDGWFGQLGQPKDADFNANGRRVVYEGRHPDAVIKQRAVSFVKKAAPQGEPFFLWVGFNAPHAPGYHEAASDTLASTRVSVAPLRGSQYQQRVATKPTWTRSESND